MITETVDKKRWDGFLDQLSKGLEGRRAEISVASLDLGSQVEAEWLPFLGMTYEPHMLDVPAGQPADAETLVRRGPGVATDSVGRWHTMYRIAVFSDACRKGEEEYGRRLQGDTTAPPSPIAALLPST